MPKISIIVPVYKVEKYLSRCVDSILLQTFTDFELILVDDGSIDESGNICDAYLEKDKRVKVIHKKNGGVSSARNAGLDLAVGKYIMFCDSDDYVDPRWCEEMFTMMESQNIEMCFCGYYLFDNQSNVVMEERLFSKRKKIEMHRTDIWDVYMKGFLNMPWNKIYRKSIIIDNNIRFDETINYNEDLLFVLDYLRCIQGEFGVCNIPLYFYVQGIPGSLTRSYVPNLWSIKQRVFDSMDTVLSHCGINKDDIRNQYYSKWLWSISCSIASELDTCNRMNILKKYKNVCKIIHSKIAKNALKYGTFDKSVSRLYEVTFRLRCALIIMGYSKLSTLKRNG